MNINIERSGRVVIVRLNRPKALNALNTALMHEMVTAMRALDNDPEVGCFIVTGSPEIFSAGADVKEMAEKTYVEVLHENFLAEWDGFQALRTPKIAAVAGYALGGGCELAMMCDTIFAAENARFGQPELNLGVIPGMGGSQRLTRLIGKAKAMDMILTGRLMDAEEAERAGLVARVFPTERLLDETRAAAHTIANYGKTAVMVAREAVNQALEMGLQQGILFERRSYHALWATADQKEGMRAFIEKRAPNFRGE
ncbi:MAG: enoyl-CoA hydratase-related protein [Chloroflexaceae bacterium]